MQHSGDSHQRAADSAASALRDADANLSVTMHALDRDTELTHADLERACHLAASVTTTLGAVTATLATLLQQMEDPLDNRSRAEQYRHTAAALAHLRQAGVGLEISQAALAAYHHVTTHARPRNGNTAW